MATGLYPIRWFGLPHLVIAGNKSTKRKWTRFTNISKILLRLKKAPPLLKDSRISPLSQHTRRVRTEFIHYKLFICVFTAELNTKVCVPRERRGGRNKSVRVMNNGAAETGGKWFLKDFLVWRVRDGAEKGGALCVV